jgi:hypothetical protein
MQKDTNFQKRCIFLQKVYHFASMFLAAKDAKKIKNRLCTSRVQEKNATDCSCFILQTSL